MPAHPVASSSTAVLVSGASPLPSAQARVEHQLLQWSPAAHQWLAYEPLTTPESPCSLLRSLRVVTYNVWFDKLTGIDLRQAALAEIVFATSENEADVVLFQEMTHDEWNTLIGIATLADGNALRDRRALLAEHIKSDWLASDYNQIERTNGSWYNTSLLVRRSYLDRHRLSARLFVRHLPSGFRRSMHYVELYDVSGVALRIGTVHLDHPVDSTGRRRQQLNLALDTLQADDVPAVLGGDFNLASPAELIPVFAQHGVADALVHYDAGPTFGLTYPGPNGAARLDYLLASRHFGATEGRRIGGQSIRVPPGAALPSKLGRGGQVYPSDHLGLFARLEVVGEDVSGGL